MKNQLLFAIGIVMSFASYGQIGIGTVSPNSTLDIRGSLALNYRAFTGNTSAGITDNTLVFTGTSATTLTLPDAASITGRSYWIKNASSNSSTLTIATTSSQTIEGLTTWTLTQQNKSLYLLSNGTNWYITSESTPGSGSGTAWIYGGNNVVSVQNIGTTSNFALPLITNNTERMRISNVGNVAIGTSSFNGTNPEKFLVDAGSTASFNVISGKGSIDNYLQLNIQNNNSGTSASSDVVATANNGNETVNFVDLGINSSTYSVSSFTVTGANDAYLYSTGNDFAIGNGTSNKVLKFFTGGTLAANERMRINQNGNVAIGATSFNGSNPEKLLVDAGTAASLNVITGKANTNGIVVNSLTNSSAGAGAGADIRTYNNVGGSVGLGINSSAYSGSTILSGAGDAVLYSNSNDLIIGNSTASKNLRFYTGGSATTNERIRINGSGNVAIGTTSFNVSNPERLVVDAGTTSSYNVISGKGSINSYLQLNIQNSSSGTVASSDIVATANNGNESVNYVNLGINSSGNTSTGTLGGANTAYLYSTGNDFAIGNSTSGKDVLFFTGGTAASNEKLRVTSAAVQPGTDNATTLGTLTKRWSIVYAANGTIQTSDFRLKKNILPLQYGLNEVMQLVPVSYDWKDNSGTNKIGLIAQEVKKLIPQVVVGDETKENLGMNYAELVPVLINAIKELKAELNETKKEIELLKKGK